MVVSCLRFPLSQAVTDALVACHLMRATTSSAGGDRDRTAMDSDSTITLDTVLLDGGRNWSVGQRQLLCLGRALLKRARIVCIDEATASVRCSVCNLCVAVSTLVSAFDFVAPQLSLFPLSLPLRALLRVRSIQRRISCCRIQSAGTLGKLLCL